MSKESPLHEAHLKAGANMVDFHGWNMPLHYKGIIAEQECTRKNVSIFDVSHMGEFSVTGAEALEFLNYLTTNNVAALVDNQAQYGVILNDEGGAIDDLIVYRFCQNDFRVCVNASNIEKDFAWFSSFVVDFDVSLQNISKKVALIAVQGRNAQKLIAGMTSFDLSQIKFYHHASADVAGIPCIVARMGYTGEDGFELACDADKGLELWYALLEAGKEIGVEPAGLGARDILRLEAGLCLYGNELNDDRIVAEAFVKPFIKMDKPDFVGKTALANAINAGLNQKLISFELVDKGVPRNNQLIINEQGKEVGIVSSGTFSPYFQKGIGMGYVNPDSGTELFIQGPRRNLKMKVVKTPIFRKDY